ncbi:hypothetical protein D3C87_1255940 [compost metagenome]
MKKIILSLALLLAPALSFAQALPQIQEQAPGLSIEVQPQFVMGDQYYTYEFGQRYVYSATYTDLVLTANGPAPTELRAINWTGSSFDVYTNCPTILYPGQQCNTRVVFQPRWEGHHYSDVIFTMVGSRIIVRFHGYGMR